MPQVSIESSAVHQRNSSTNFSIRAVQKLRDDKRWREKDCEHFCEMLSLSMNVVITLLYGSIVLTSSLTVHTAQNSDHLVVLSHGIMGTGEDLGYLANLLKQSGCSVLSSISNEKMKSLGGLKTGGENLASEILDCVANNRNLKRLSVVGNSLGGLYTRYAMKLLFNDSDKTIGGLKPNRFMSIATPHLGVQNWTFVDDFGYTAPMFVKRLVSRSMLSTGRDIFSMEDKNSEEETLLFKMATNEAYLSPLRCFSDRRLYANLNRDFVVPLGTAAFMDKASVENLRKVHNGESGIVTVIKVPATSPNHLISSDDYDKRREVVQSADTMIGRLNDLGWDKVIVNFPGLLPIAHNKICALAREPKWLYETVLGFNAGQFVMEDANDWLAK